MSVLKEMSLDTRRMAAAGAWKGQTGDNDPFYRNGHYDKISTKR